MGLGDSAESNSVSEKYRQKTLNDYLALLKMADADGNKKITKEELNKFNSVFNNKQGVKYVNVQELIKKVFNKTEEELQNGNDIPKTTQYQLEEWKRMPLADALYKELNKSSVGKQNGDNQRLLSLIKLVNKDNIEEINQYFKENYGDDLNTSIQSARLCSETSKNMSAHLMSCSSNEEYKYQSPEQLAKDLYDDIRARGTLGLPTTGKNFEKHINAINKSNVYNVLTEYKNLTKGEHSLISDILSEYGLNFSVRAKYARHIFYSFVDLLKDSIYTKDLVEKFENELKYQKDKWTPADSERMDALMDELMARYNGKIIGPQKENVEYNGKIDKDFKQGVSTGDCWLVASIKALAIQPKGLAILNNMIKIKPNGDVTVTLKGVNKTYEFTREEILRHTEYATGDLDVRIIEMAVNKYYEEKRGVDGQPDIAGGRTSTALRILTGDEGNFEFWEQSDPISDKKIDNFNKQNHIACVGRSKSCGSKTLKVKNTDGTEATLTDTHSYTVSRSDAGFVYLINPWDTSKEIKVDRKTFKEFF